MGGARKLLNEQFIAFLGFLIGQMPVLAKGIAGARDGELIGQYQCAKSQLQYMT